MGTAKRSALHRSSKLESEGAEKQSNAVAEQEGVPKLRATNEL